MSELTQKGIQALKSGERAAARGLLATAVQQDPNDAQAWLWLTGALDSDEERLACLRQVLRIDPTNQAAARGLAQIMEKRKQAAPPPPIEDQAQSAPEAPAQETVSASASVEEAIPPQTEESQPGDPTTALRDALPADTAPARPPAAGTERRKRTGKSEENRRIFHARPSLVPALACFWLFLLGPTAILALINTPAGRILAAIVALVLLLIDFYVIITTMATHYELTSQQVRLRSGSQKISVDVSDIYAVECRQGGLQKLFGLGDIEMDTAANGVLAHIRMRNIANCKMRTEQIQRLTQTQG